MLIKKSRAKFHCCGLLFAYFTVEMLGDISSVIQSQGKTSIHFTSVLMEVKFLMAMAMTKEVLFAHGQENKSTPRVTAAY